MLTHLDHLWMVGEKDLDPGADERRKSRFTSISTRKSGMMVFGSPRELQMIQSRVKGCGDGVFCLWLVLQANWWVSKFLRRPVWRC